MAIMIAVDSGGASFDIGTLVNIESRTWAGINKPGGVGRVTAFNHEDCTVDVKYVLGGGEKGVDLEFVQQHKFEGDSGGGDNDGRGRPSRRRRSMDLNTNNSKAGTSNEKQKPAKKRALKDGSNSANKLKGATSTEKEQVKEAKVGVKRKVADTKGEMTNEGGKKDANMKESAKKQKIAKTNQTADSIKIASTKGEKKEAKLKKSVKKKMAVKKNQSTASSKTTNAKGEKTCEGKVANPKKSVKKQKNAKKNHSVVSGKIAKNKVTPILTQESVPGAEVGASVENVEMKAAKKDKSSKKKSKQGKKLKEKQESKNSTTASKPTSAATATIQKNTKITSPVSIASGQKQDIQKISCSAKVLKHVYKDMSDKATSFVKEIVGKSEVQLKKEVKNESSTPSSPDSTSSLDIRMEEGRETEFDELFSGIMRQKMLEAIEIENLTKEIARRVKGKPFTELEVRQHLERLDKSNKVMLSSGSIYVL